MSLPVEIRIMTFRYLFPEVVRSAPWEARTVKVGILKVNRQIYKEATSVLYGEALFKAVIEPGAVKFLGKIWRRYDNTDMAETINATAAGRIQRLELRIDLGYNPYAGGIAHSVSTEEHEIYDLRDTVRKFVKMMTGSASSADVGEATLKHFHIKPRVLDQHQWSTDEMFAAVALVIEPFRFLGPIEHPRLTKPTGPKYDRDYLNSDGTENVKFKKLYDSLHDEWIAALQKGTRTGSNKNNASRIDRLYRQIEDGLRITQLEHIKKEHPWVVALFKGSERSLHQARVAYEDQDVDALEKIKDAIGTRWAYGYREQQRSLRGASALFCNMFDSDSDGARGRYPDAFLVDGPGAVLSIAPSPRWSELADADTAPEIGDPGVTFFEGLLRVTIQKDGTTWTRLKTPAMVRELRILEDLENIPKKEILG
jgi:hypothetical protein